VAHSVPRASQRLMSDAQTNPDAKTPKGSTFFLFRFLDLTCVADGFENTKSG
jgi:hypothetical protein